jgi:outer membrane protein
VIRSISTTALIGLVVLMALPAALHAQGKIVYIDSYRIRLEYKEFQDAQDQFNKEVDEWNQEIEQGQAEIDDLETALAKQALILSDAKRQEKEQEIENKKAEWQKLANDIFGPNGRAERRNAELTKPLLEKINTVLERIANQEGYAMILDAVNGNIAFGKKDLDITDKVLEELEKQQ